jgi:predicted nucleic acid-binding protein
VEFLDTNVLVYAAGGLPADRRKARLARALVSGGDRAISLQVLQEFYLAARHPKKLAFTHEEAVTYCRQWRRFTMLEPTLALFEDALTLCARFEIAYWDAAILAAAAKLSCRVVLSEDLNAGQNYDGVGWKIRSQSLERYGRVENVRQVTASGVRKSARRGRALCKARRCKPAPLF